MIKYDRPTIFSFLDNQFPKVIQLSPKTMADVEAERKMGTRFSSNVFLWRLPSSSCRVWSRAVVPFTKVSMISCDASEI